MYRYLSAKQKLPDNKNERAVEKIR